MCFTGIAGLQLILDFQRIEADVEVRTGFINKIDVQSTELMAGYAWRYNRGKVKRFSFDLEGNLKQDSRGHLTGNSLRLMFFTDFFSRINFHGGIDVGKSKHQIFDENDELAWTEDFISTSGGDLDFHWERGGFFKEVSIEGGWEKRGTLERGRALNNLKSIVSIKNLNIPESWEAGKF